MSRIPSRLTLAAAAFAAAAAIAACGSSSHDPTSSSTSSGPPTAAQQQQFQQDAIKFTACMRSHGVAGFPDPSSPGQFKVALSPDSPEARSPAFQSAYTACHHLLPGGGPSQSDRHSPAQVAALLAMATCLRAHGFTSFPDPTTSGQLTQQMVANAGINLHQPAVLQAADACVSATHGMITRAMVAQFIAGQ